MPVVLTGWPVLQDTVAPLPRAGPSHLGCLLSACTGLNIYIKESPGLQRPTSGRPRLTPLTWRNPLHSSSVSTWVPVVRVPVGSSHFETRDVKVFFCRVQGDCPEHSLSCFDKNKNKKQNKQPQTIPKHKAESLSLCELTLHFGSAVNTFARSCCSLSHSAVSPSGRRVPHLRLIGRSTRSPAKGGGASSALWVIPRTSRHRRPHANVYQPGGPGPGV